jgi:predicted transposase YdaD
MAKHDHGYKLLFSHPTMVEDLVRGFVSGPWVVELDFATPERVQASYVSEDLVERASDVVWRLRWRDERWMYLYVLIEFQSTVDRFMALRVLTYVGLLCQDLVRQRVLDGVKRLPPVLPIVLYNGRDARTEDSRVGRGPAAGRRGGNVAAPTGAQVRSARRGDPGASRRGRLRAAVDVG